MQRPAPHPRPWWSRLPSIVLALCAAPGLAATDADLARCRAVADRNARLACYDALAAPASAAIPQPPSSPAPAKQAASPAQKEQSVAGAHTTTSLSKFWELEPGDKQGAFRVRPYQSNYVLPLKWNTRINQAPQSPTHPAASVPSYRHLEATVQLSFRAKVVQGLVLPDADLWFGYTNRAQWQVWTPESSRPFRNTDYEPEFIYVVPTPDRWQPLPLGWRWRMSTLAVTHQSNGQANPLSRSWNRVTVGAAVERGEFGVQAQVWRRIPEPLASDDNPDLTHYIGRGELRASWQPGRAIAAVTWRTNFRDTNRGSVQLDWTYPVFDDTQGLRVYLRAFNGYGESLADYNFRKTSIGAGVMLFAF